MKAFISILNAKVTIKVKTAIVWFEFSFQSSL